MNNYQGTQFSLLNNDREAYSNGKVSYWVNDPLKNTIQMRSPAALDNQIRKPKLYSAYGPNGFGFTYKAGLHEQQLPFLNQSVETIDPFSGERIENKIGRPKHNLITAKNNQEFFLSKYTNNRRVKNGNLGTRIDRSHTNINYDGNTIDHEHYPNFNPYREIALNNYETEVLARNVNAHRGPTGDQGYLGFPTGITGRRLITYRNNNAEANVRQGPITRTSAGGGSSGVAGGAIPQARARKYSDIPGKPFRKAWNRDIDPLFGY